MAVLDQKEGHEAFVQAGSLGRTSPSCGHSTQSPASGEPQPASPHHWCVTRPRSHGGLHQHGLCRTEADKKIGPVVLHKAARWFRQPHHEKKNIYIYIWFCTDESPEQGASNLMPSGRSTADTVTSPLDQKRHQWASASLSRDRHKVSTRE